MTRIKFPLVCEARHILDMVKNSFNNIEEFHALCYGKPIEVAQANDLVQEYIRLCGISDILLEFTTDLSCNARLLTRKHSTKAYKKKKINLIINEDSESNQSYLRELGILCLSDHEIGTHYCRFTNDHKQLWHNARKNFGLSPLVDYQIRRTEEGLATINGIINANVPLLFRTALSYYVAYLMHQHTMSYVLELIQPYIANQAEGVKMCQRCLRNSKLNKIPIHAYFDGAVDILRNIDKIDFTLLMSGKISKLIVRS
ncbi:hypothetical protein SNEBB_002187 [Seison nebaliae]|nr:hypothetical protein SNEBB_002187 [Seison nebaliae]